MASDKTDLKNVRTFPVSVKKLQDDVAAPSSFNNIDLDSYDLADAFRQIQGKEKKLRDELALVQSQKQKLELEIQDLKNQIEYSDKEKKSEQNLFREKANLEQQVKILQTKTVESEEKLKLEQHARSREKQALSDALAQNSARYEELRKQYDEVSQYSKQLLQSAERRMQLLEQEVLKQRTNSKSLELELNQAQITIQRLKEHQGDFQVEKTKYSQLVSDVHVRDSYWQKQIQNHKLENQVLRSKLEENESHLHKAQFEKAQAEARLKIQVENVLMRNVQLSKVRDILSGIIKGMDSLQRSAKDLTKESATKMTAMLAAKAAGILFEQWRTEIENLRKLDVMVAELSDDRSEKK